MKICLIVEGCYPYVLGGVSNWIHSIIKAFPNIEFNLIAIISDRSNSGKFTYELPDNLTEIHEVYLQDVDWIGSKRHTKKSNKIKINKIEEEALKSLVIGEDVDWTTVFKLFDNKNISVNNFLMSPQFLKMSKDYYELKYVNITFTDFLWTLRSIYLPLFLALKCKPPKADIYHCVSTGYAGVIGSKAISLYPSAKLLISEHGIYTREREEEIIKAKWVQNIYKTIWIDQFKKMSKGAYYFADLVTSLFKGAQQIQLELGCPLYKSIVTPNGIEPERFEGIQLKHQQDDPFINVGAILRIAPIKDVKTMINAFYYAHKKQPKLKLWLMGPEEDAEYAEECHELVRALDAKNIMFEGRIQTTDYIGKMDMMILTSISEGQPLTILEGFAAKKPCIATNVGNCHGLIYGENDTFGAAGIVVPVMNVSEISNAILKMANNPDKTKEMGDNGYKRLMYRYKHQYMIDDYRKIYNVLTDISNDFDVNKLVRMGL